MIGFALWAAAGLVLLAGAVSQRLHGGDPLAESGFAGPFCVPAAVALVAAGVVGAPISYGATLWLTILGLIWLRAIVRSWARAGSERR